MTWENAINIKLNLGDISRQIISDRTGILFSSEFLAFLDESGIPFLHSAKLEDLIRQGDSSKYKIIITSLKEIPEYLSSKADIKYFTLADIPITADVQVLQSLSGSELIQLLNYLNATGLLQAVNKNNIQSLLQSAQEQRANNAINVLIKAIESILQSEVNYENILQLGALFGQLQFLCFQYSEALYQQKLSSLQQRLDEYSYNYILSGNLKNIFYESSSNVLSVSSILTYLKSVHKSKTALICFDCMGMAEWYLLKEYLRALNLSYNERQSFALLPSITSISRAAIYYGSYSEVFSLSYVNEEKALKSGFNGMSCRLFREKDVITADSLLGIDIVSVIYNFFDDFSHASIFPTNFDNKSLYFTAVRNYLNNSALLNQITLLLDEGYQLYFCSDHGSVVATGNGKRIERYLQDKFAKRACLIDDTTLAELLDYPQMKVPFVEGKTLVLPHGRTMFDQLDNIEISHGGITIEEIVVPFIKVLK